MGITGAAIATLISQCFGCAMLFWMTHKGQNIRIHLRNFTPTRAYFKEIIFGGTPSLSRQGLGSIATLVLNVAAGAYGDAAIAGMSIVTRISFFTYAVVIGLGQGFQPLCGFCYGAKLYDRVKEAFYFLHQMRHGISGWIVPLSASFSLNISSNSSVMTPAW